MNNPTNWAEIEREFEERFVGDVQYSSTEEAGRRIDNLRSIKFLFKDFLKQKLIEAEKRGFDRACLLYQQEPKDGAVQVCAGGCEYYGLIAAREESGSSV